MASYYLEQMLLDLDILQNRGIFSDNEIKSIIKERTHYEYAIHRRIPKKTDFLKYLQYEINLEQLRRLRMDKLTKEQKLKGSSSRERAADFSILKRIHYLYQKTLKKYAEDVDIWLQYFDYCQETGSAKILGRFYAKAIQMHPKKPIFWIHSALWEFNVNMNVEAARRIFQRSLRMNPEEESLWLEYFGLEAKWIIKVQERRKLLSSKSAEDSEIVQSLGPTEELPMIVNIEEYGILKVIFQHAIAAIPNRPTFIGGFLRQIKDHSIRNEDLETLIVSTLESMIETNPQITVILAENKLPKDLTYSDAPFELKGAIEYFRNALLSREHQIWDDYFEFLIKCTQRYNEPHLTNFLNTVLSRDLNDQLNKGHLTRKSLDILFDMNLEISNETLKKAIDLFPFDAMVLARYADYCLTSQLDMALVIERIPQCQDVEPILVILAKQWSLVPSHQIKPILSLLIQTPQASETLSQIITLAFQSASLAEVWSFYRDSVDYSKRNVAFFKSMSQLLISKSATPQQIETVFESAVRIYPDNQELWSCYVHYEEHVAKNFKKLADLLFRIKK